ncbi:MAG: hypothetical protein RSA70_00620 [Clostridia bacterium]
MNFKKITIFAGHYGSGKTNLAVNLALHLRKSGMECALCDLDIVNPYFRSKDSEDELSAAGIRLISSEFANSNLDVPSIPPAAYAVFAQGDISSVIDLGGDDRGAYALGRFSEFLQDSADYDMLLVINKFRPDTATPQDALDIAREIEGACHVKFTGIVNNSNLGRETTRELIESTVPYANEVSRVMELPLIMTTHRRDITVGIPDAFPIDLMVKSGWML